MPDIPQSVRDAVDAALAELPDPESPFERDRWRIVSRVTLDAAAPLLAEAWGAFECEPLRTESTTAETEWGVRYGHQAGRVGILGTGRDNEHRARHEVSCWPESAVLVRRTVTYGPWVVMSSSTAATREDGEP